MGSNDGSNEYYQDDLKQFQYSDCSVTYTKRNQYILYVQEQFVIATGTHKIRGCIPIPTL